MLILLLASCPATTEPTRTDASGACGQIPTFEDGRTPSLEIHVAIDGDDDAGDGTPAHPYASIGRAAEDAAPGAAIRVHAGTYPGGTFLEGLAGTAQAPIWIGGAPGEARPVLAGGAEGLHVSRGRYLVVHDLEVRDTDANGINTDDGGDYADPTATQWVVFRDLDLHDIGGDGNQDCLKLSGVDDFFVLDSTFARCGGGGSGSGVDHVGCHRGLVARNTFTEMSGNAVQAKGGSADLELRWNLVLDGGERGFNLGGSTDPQYFRPPLDPTAENAEARRLLAVANVIVGSVAPVAFVGCVDCVVAHNTLVDPERWVARILQETVSDGTYAFAPARNGQFVNNLVWYDRSALSAAEDVNVGPDTAPDTFVFSHDLWYAHDDPAASAPRLPVAEPGAVIGQDPLLPDPRAGDVQISAISPAAGAGAAVPEAPTGDRAGACWSSPPSIGAYEAASSAK